MPNFLIGHGETLVQALTPPGRRFDPVFAYTYEQATEWHKKRASL